jgi:hypothetical protein
MLRKIVSGGQTGADRAGLDFAIDRGIPHGGWCPRGRWAEDGSIDPKYCLLETPSSDPTQRTEWNVRDSDGTVIFSIAPSLTGGSQKTLEFAEEYHKPCLRLYGTLDPKRSGEILSEFLRKHGIEVLNVAGPRGSHEAGIQDFTRQILDRLEPLIFANLQVWSREETWAQKLHV